MQLNKKNIRYLQKYVHTLTIEKKLTLRQHYRGRTRRGRLCIKMLKHPFRQPRTNDTVFGLPPSLYIKASFHDIYKSKFSRYAG